MSGIKGTPRPPDKELRKRKQDFTPYGVRTRSKTKENCEQITNNNFNILTEKMDQQKLQQQIDELKKQMQRLSQTNESLRAQNLTLLEQANAAQQARLEAANQVAHAQQLANANLERLQGISIIEHLQTFNTNVRIPKFNDKINPKEYLEQIKKYFDVKAIRAPQQILMLENILDAPIKVWYQNVKNSIQNFDQFKEAFLKQFYSIPIRLHFKARWQARRYTSEVTMQEYFYRQVNEAQYFEPPVLPYEVNFSIIQQMPLQTRMALATIDYSQTNQVSQALAQLDLAQSTHYQFYNVQNNQDLDRCQINAFGFTSSNNNHDNNNNHNNWRSRSDGQGNGGYNSRPRRNNYNHFNNQNNSNNNSNVSLPDLTVPPPSMSQNNQLQSQNVPHRNNTYTNANNNNRQPNNIQNNDNINNGGYAGSVNCVSTKAMSANDFVDFVDDLCEEVDGNLVTGKTRSVSTEPCPKLKIHLYDEHIKALIDTGSQISAISEDKYHQINSKVLLDTLPISNMTINTAVSAKAVAIKRQVLIKFRIDNLIIEHPMLIIPKLNQDVLLGSDWCRSNDLVIDYKLNKINVKGKLIDHNNAYFKYTTPEDKQCDLVVVHSPSVQHHTMVNIITCPGIGNGLKDQSLPIQREMIIDHDDDGVLDGIRNIMSSVVSKSTREFKIDNDNHLLDDKSSSNLITLIDKYNNLFSNAPGCMQAYHHAVKVIPGNPIVKKNYPVPFALRELVQEEINKMLELGVIERSRSQYCNPLRVVKKKDGAIRLCLDARFVNNVIEGDNESPPIIGEVIQKFNGSGIFTTLDLTAGYWQVPLDEQSRQYTAFLFGSQLYQYCRMPFGLKTSGSGFIRALNIVFGQDFHHFLTYYIDDLIIASKNVQDHLIHLDQVFQRLVEHGFTVKLSKARFCQDSVPFLGYILTSTGCRPNPDKLKDIQSFHEPKQKSDLQQFMGICQYYKQFSVNRAVYLDVLRELLKKDVAWTWTEEHAEAFRKLKFDFLKIVELKYYDLQRDFYVQTDASDRGISAILYQKDDQGQHQLISVVSRCIQSAELNYTTTEKELLAVIYAVQKFRVFLMHRKFHIITDHQALVFLKRSAFHTARLSRWNLLLQEFDFDICHCRGLDNLVADFFSRHPDGRFHTQSKKSLLVNSLTSRISLEGENLLDCALVKICVLKLSPETKKHLKEIKKLQQEDEALIQYLRVRLKGPSAWLFHEYKGMWFHQARGVNNWCLIIPEVLQKIVIITEHERLGHPGVFKVLSHLKRNYWFKGMEKLTKYWVLRCDLCQRVKHLGRVIEGEQGFVSSDSPGELVTVDFYGPLPESVGKVKYIFVVIDAFSKLVKLYPIVKANTATVLRKIFIDYTRDVGKPRRILADNGTQFTSHKWRYELEQQDIKVHFCSIRHPQSNPTERVMRELGRMFRTFCSQSHVGWAREIKTIEKILNHTTHCSTGFIPQELHFGVNVQDEIRNLFDFPESPGLDHQHMIVCAKENLRRAHEQRRNQQKSSKSSDLGVGDKVLLRVPHLSSNTDRVTHKFFHLFEGPYLIKKRIGTNAYILETEDKNNTLSGTYNRISLRKYLYDPAQR